MQDSSRVLRDFRDKCRFVVVTSRRTSLEEITRNWLDTYYEGIFEDVLFANHYANDGSNSTTKSELCKSVGAKVLVDDSLEYIKEAAPYVTTAIFFGDYAWNRTSQNDLPSNTKRVHNWRGLASLLHQLNQDGSILPMDAISIRNIKSHQSYVEAIRRTLENQERVSVTSVGVCISTAAETIEALQRAGEIEVESFRTGTDAAAPNHERSVRLTAVVKATPTLRNNLIEQANKNSQKTVDHYSGWRDYQQYADANENQQTNQQHAQ